MSWDPWPAAAQLATPSPAASQTAPAASPVPHKHTSQHHQMTTSHPLHLVQCICSVRRPTRPPLSRTSLPRHRLSPHPQNIIPLSGTTERLFSRIISPVYRSTKRTRTMTVVVVALMYPSRRVDASTAAWTCPGNGCDSRTISSNTAPSLIIFEKKRQLLRGLNHEFTLLFISGLVSGTCFSAMLSVL